MSKSESVSNEEIAKIISDKVNNYNNKAKEYDVLTENHRKLETKSLILLKDLIRKSDQHSQDQQEELFRDLELSRTELFNFQTVLLRDLRDLYNLHTDTTSKTIKFYEDELKRYKTPETIFEEQ